MKVKYTSPNEVQLYIAKAILAHQKKLSKKFKNNKITYEELKRKEFPIDAIRVLEKAVQDAFNENSCDAVIDAEQYLKSYPLRTIAANEN